MTWRGEAKVKWGWGKTFFFFSLPGPRLPWQNPYSWRLTRFLQRAAYSPLSGMLVQIVHRSVTTSPPIPAICRQYLFIHLGEERQCKELRQLQYHSWYFKTVSYFTRLTAREITYNNFEIALVVFMPNITTNHAITFTNNLLQCISK